MGEVGRIGFPPGYLVRTSWERRSSRAVSYEMDAATASINATLPHHLPPTNHNAMPDPDPNPNPNPEQEDEHEQSPEDLTPSALGTKE